MPKPKIKSTAIALVLVSSATSAFGVSPIHYVPGPFPQPDALTTSNSVQTVQKDRIVLEDGKARAVEGHNR